jgi:hypothetical protein
MEFTKLIPPPVTPASGKFEHEKLTRPGDRAGYRFGSRRSDHGGWKRWRVRAAARSLRNSNVPSRTLLYRALTHTVQAWVVRRETVGAANVSRRVAYGRRHPGRVKDAVSKLQPAVMGFETGKSYLNVDHGKPFRYTSR